MTTESTPTAILQHLISNNTPLLQYSNTRFTAVTPVTSLEFFKGQLVRLSDCFIPNISSHHVDTAGETRFLFDGSLHTAFRQILHESCGNVRQGLRCRSSIGARHIRHTIVGDSLFHVDRIMVRGRARSFATASTSLW